MLLDTEVFRTCTWCRESKPSSEYYYDKKRNKTHAWCKTCANAKRTERLQTAVGRANRRRWWKKYYQTHKAEVKAQVQYRTRRVRRATPPWVDVDEIKQIYLDAQKISDQMGEIHHVDHIVPLNGETVCGLHVPWNLRIITADWNRRKYTKMLHTRGLADVSD